MTRGKTHGGLISPTLSNMVFENMMRNWLTMMAEEKIVAHDGLGLAVGRYMGIFYVADGLVGSQDP